MKKITLAPRGRRMLAGLIDLILITLPTVLIYLFGVMPFVFDFDTTRANQEQINTLFKECDLFLVNDKDEGMAKSDATEIKKLEDLYNVNITFNNEVYENVSCTKSLYTFYTTQNEKYLKAENFTDKGYQDNVLKVGSKESNIASYDVSTNRFTLIDPEKENTTYFYIKDVFRKATAKIIKVGPIYELRQANSKITIDALVYLLPVIFGVSLITNLIVPICSPYGQTVGKWCTGLIVLDKEGYVLKKGWYVPRWLAFTAIEYIGGALTMGGLFLISYTMFMFSKKRRCLHDFMSNSVVAIKRDSIFFKDKLEERRFEERRQSFKGSRL